MVVRLDLEDFFAGVTAARVFGIFRAAGYPESVAHVLTGLCTNVVPLAESVSGHYRLARRLATPHLPQGAPTSPALANLGGVRARPPPDRPGRAPSAPATRRYADDLVLSSDAYLRTPVDDDRQRSPPTRASASTRAKTRVMGRGRRQTVTGIVVNAHPNVAARRVRRCSRRSFTAPRCDGPADLDPAHLLGRIAWVESLNPARGAKLRASFTAIHMGSDPLTILLALQRRLNC